MCDEVNVINAVTPKIGEKSPMTPLPYNKI